MFEPARLRLRSGGGRQGRGGPCGRGAARPLGLNPGARPAPAAARAGRDGGHAWNPAAAAAPPPARGRAGPPVLRREVPNPLLAFPPLVLGSDK